MSASQFQRGLELSDQIARAQQGLGDYPVWMFPTVRSPGLDRDGTVVCISGSRTFVDEEVVEKAIESLLDRQVRIIVGDAVSGVDKMVREMLDGIDGFDPDRDVFKANWRYLGRGAGHQRNERMISIAHELMAIFSDGPRTPGTQDCFGQAVIKRIPVSYYENGIWRYLAGV